MVLFCISKHCSVKMSSLVDVYLIKRLLKRVFYQSLQNVYRGRCLSTKRLSKEAFETWISFLTFFIFRKAFSLILGYPYNQKPCHMENFYRSSLDIPFFCALWLFLLYFAYWLLLYTFWLLFSSFFLLSGMLVRQEASLSRGGWMGVSN